MQGQLTQAKRRNRPSHPHHQLQLPAHRTQQLMVTQVEWQGQQQEQRQLHS